MKYIEWDGSEDDEDDESNVDCKQVDDPDQKDSAKIDRKPRFPVTPVYHKVRRKTALWRRLLGIPLALMSITIVFL